MAVAQKTIVDNDGGLTTFCSAVVLPARRPTNGSCPAVSAAAATTTVATDLHARRYAVCVINVGDSLAFVLGRRTGLREVTVGSHDLQQARDVRDAGGALGLVDGSSPALDNLTCSLTFADEGDIVFLTTDGITDNFDPVVTKLAAPAAADRPGNGGASAVDAAVSHDGRAAESSSSSQVRLPLVMLPLERHQLAVKSMEMSVHEFELGRGKGRCGGAGGKDVSAFELCLALMRRVVQLTDGKRKVIEDSALYRRPPGTRLSRKERQDVEAEIRRQLTQCPGKLDHATVVAYEVGECKEQARAAALAAGAASSSSLPSDCCVAAADAASVAMRRYLASASLPVAGMYDASTTLIPAHN